MKNIISNNFGLKIIALALAIISWLYIMGEIKGTGNSQKSIFDFTFPEHYINKVVPVKINITGVPASGYHTSLEKVSIKPGYCIVVGPQSLINHLEYIITESIDISGATKTVVRQIALQKIANQKLVSSENLVEVTIPVEPGK